MAAARPSHTDEKSEHSIADDDLDRVSVADDEHSSIHDSDSSHDDRKVNWHNPDGENRIWLANNMVAIIAQCREAKIDLSEEKDLEAKVHQFASSKLSTHQFVGYLEDILLEAAKPRSKLAAFFKPASSAVASAAIAIQVLNKGGQEYHFQRMIAALLQKIYASPHIASEFRAELRQQLLITEGNGALRVPEVFNNVYIPFIPAEAHPGEDPAAYAVPDDNDSGNDDSEDGHHHGQPVAAAPPPPAVGEVDHPAPGPQGELDPPPPSRTPSPGSK